MRASFFGLNVAVRGLFSSQRALDVTNHNINNVNTPGYSRQVAQQRAGWPMALNDGTGMVGTGSEVYAVKRIRDDFLDFKYWSENLSYGEWETKKNALSEIEAVFGEPAMYEDADSGFSKVFGDFYEAVDDVSEMPEDETARMLVRQTANTLCQYLNSTATRFQQLREENNYGVKVTVDQINSYASQIRDINRQIYMAELDGNDANDLRDRRSLLVDKLSKLVNVEVREVTVGGDSGDNPSTYFQVLVNDSYLVNHVDVYHLECYENAERMYDIRWKDSGNAMKVKGGQLKGYMEVRDGQGNGDFKGIPYYIDKLNEFARTFAMAFNEGIYKDGKQYMPGHAGGIGEDGSTGIRFFTYDNISSDDLMAAGATMELRYENITAANITISSDIQADDGIYKIAAAKAGAGIGDNHNMEMLLSLRDDKRVFGVGTPEDFMRSIVSNLGVDTKHVKRVTSNQELLVTHIETRRISVSGVSIDEEMANLVKYQQAYNAAAKMITVMDEVYDVMIHGMGKVGR